MAPSDKKLEAELLSAVREVYKTNSDDLTVNFVRKRVESDLDLEDGFFSSAKWKDRSKKLIKTLATELLENGAPAESDAEKDDEEEVKPKKKTAKRQSTEASPPPKRRKRASGKAEEVDDDDSESEKPKTKSKAKPKPKPKQKTARSKKSQDTIESDEELSAVEEKPAKARNGRASKVEASDSDALSSPPVSEDEKEEKEEEATKSKSPPKATPKEKSPAGKPSEDAAEKKDEEPPVDDTSSELSELIDEPPKPKGKKAAEEPPVIDDTSSELSELIDEPPKPKRKKKEAGAGKATKPKKAPATSDNPDDAEIKKLQSQLVKCGIRKIWGFELKQYGDNTKAKIKHLKGMLNDIGMDGRFSEARAREIKERRELQADLEAVQEMDANWGASGRSSRSKARGQPPPKAAKEDLDDEGGDDDDEDEEAVVSSRARGKARADLAFLGDDDEESD